ncbi:MAG: DUF4031 domain-containing protein [Geodermatophilaceae bacterium]
MIDRPIWPGRGRRWSHLCSDPSLAELHEFARRLGVPARALRAGPLRRTRPTCTTSRCALGAEPVPSQRPGAATRPRPACASRKHRSGFSPGLDRPAAPS